MVWAVERNVFGRYGSTERKAALWLFREERANAKEKSMSNGNYQSGNSA